MQKHQSLTYPTKSIGGGRSQSELQLGQQHIELQHDEAPP
jgi:hypothetical protein